MRRGMRWRAAGLAVSVGLLILGCVSSATPTSSEKAVAVTSAPVDTEAPATVPLHTEVPAPAVEPTHTALAIAQATAPATAPAEVIEPVTFTIVYDNNAYNPSLRTDWGFACLVETGEATVLFDTGAKGTILLDNMGELGFDPQVIDVVVLSHIHGDHTGGLRGLLDTGARPVVYVPASFPASFKDDVRAVTDLVEVTDPVEILPGVHTTGEVGSSIVEQALVVETGAGLVVVTGCAHPGVVEMVRRAKEAIEGEVGLVMGGFHLGGASSAQIEAIIADFRELGVQQVAPSHCTGDRARQMFAKAYGDDCTLSGVGQVFVVGGTR
jgi:7,8-dihydropterin-6-yl-methyl-4-(beta-D-ribofuranosyl)aminobenzene 5'-phosphate synthase